jgi:hypothetical protein
MTGSDVSLGYEHTDISAEYVFLFVPYRKEHDQG